MHDLDLALREMEGDNEGPEGSEFEFGDSEYEDNEGVSQSDEIELASELLEVTSDQELDQFFGSKLFKKLKHAAKGPLGSIVKSLAKKALPMLGTAAGTFFGGPLGASMGAKAGQMASQMFGLELEGMSEEDQDLEVARRVVRLASDAARQVAKSPGGDPVVTAKNAVMAAASRHAPGLIARAQVPGPAARRGGNGTGGGRWVRRGNKIIIFGV